jgi:quinol monooxygenase YgiN
MVTLTIRVTARSDKYRELLSACRLIADQVRTEVGALDCRLSQDIDNEYTISIEEHWKDRACLDDHLRSETFSALCGAVKLLGESHAIEIGDGFKTEGKEAVQAVRLKKHKSDK